MCACVCAPKGPFGFILTILIPWTISAFQASAYVIPFVSWFLCVSTERIVCVCVCCESQSLNHTRSLWLLSTSSVRPHARKRAVGMCASVSIEAFMFWNVSELMVVVTPLPRARDRSLLCVCVMLLPTGTHKSSSLPYLALKQHSWRCSPSNELSLSGIFNYNSAS